MGSKQEKPEGLGQEIAKILGSPDADPKARIEAMHRLLNKKTAAKPASAGIYNPKGLKQQALQNTAPASAPGAEPALAPDISVVTDFKNLLACYRIRRAVFTEEQGIPQELDIDNDDLYSIHFLIYDGRKPVGTGRMTPGKSADAKVGRVAILKAFRRRGLGSRLMNFILRFATQQKLSEIVISAQQPSVPFYEKLGFSPVGAPYREANIPHLKMVKKLHAK